MSDWNAVSSFGISEFCVKVMNPFCCLSNFQQYRALQRLVW